MVASIKGGKVVISDATLTKEHAAASNLAFHGKQRQRELDSQHAQVSIARQFCPRCSTR